MLKHARLSVSIIFLIHGMNGGSWLARIPAVQARLGLSVSQLGLALLGAAIGALIAMVNMPRLIRRFGSARATRWSALAFCAAIPLGALGWNTASLALLLVLQGAAGGALNVAMNTQAVEVERAYGRPIMVRFHALFSLGGMFGAAVGGWAAMLGSTPVLSLGATGFSLGVVASFATRHLLVAENRRQDESAAMPPWAMIRSIFGLAAIGFCIVFCEGALADWSAVYLTTFASQGLAAAGYAAFSFMMAFGRLTGDRLRSYLGPVMTVRLGAFSAAAGLTMALAIGGFVPGLLGFTIAGAGWATIFPIASGAAGHRTPRAEMGVAVVSTSGFVAYLAAPALIGFLAQAFTLRKALASIVVLSLAAGFLAPSVADDLRETS